jgi:uncharacterized protein
MAKIIISYRRSDSDVFAGRIRDRVASRYGDASVFMDIDDIPFGKDFRQHIKDALTSSDLVVVIIGPRWLGGGKSGRARIHDETDPVRIEVETALQHGVPIIPVLVGDTKMPKPAQLPEALQDFAFINAAPVDTGRDFHPHMERLLREIDKILRARTGEPLPAPARPPRERKKAVAARGIWIGGALVVAALLAGVGLSRMPTFSSQHAASGNLAAVVAPRTGGPAVPAAPLSIPGLDCGQPKTQVERTICDSEDLSSKYKLLHELYLFLQSRRPTDEQLRADQSTWRAALEQCRGDAMFGCINNAQDARIVALKIGPSYPCHIDKKRVEQAICKDAVLSTKDQVMHDLYQLVITEMTVATYRGVRTDQQNWINERRDACDEPDMIPCINRAYDARLAELDGLAARR